MPPPRSGVLCFSTEWLPPESEVLGRRAVSRNWGPRSADELHLSLRVAEVLTCQVFGGNVVHAFSVLPRQLFTQTYQARVGKQLVV